MPSLVQVCMRSLYEHQAFRCTWNFCGVEVYQDGINRNGILSSDFVLATLMALFEIHPSGVGANGSKVKYRPSYIH